MIYFLLGVLVGLLPAFPCLWYFRMFHRKEISFVKVKRRLEKLETRYNHLADSIYAIKQDLKKEGVHFSGLDD